MVGLGFRGQLLVAVAMGCRRENRRAGDVPASSLAGEDEGGGRCADTRLAVGRLARSLGVRRQVRGHGVVREPTLKAQATLG